MPKVIRGDIREIVLKIKEYFIKEKQNNGPLIPFRKIHERVAAATGISLHTVSNIVKEGNVAQTTSSKIVTPGKIRKIRKDKLVMNDFAEEVFRKKIYEFYAMKREIQSIEELHRILKEEIEFKGSREILRQEIKKIGFVLMKIKKNKKVLIDKSSYLQAMKQKEQMKRIPDIYFNDTYNLADGLVEPMSKRYLTIYSGGDQELGENADLTNKSNTKNGHIKWATKKETPQIYKSPLFVVDNALYQTTSVNKIPNSASKKSEIEEWLNSHNIEFSPDMTRQQLLDMMKTIKAEPMYAVDARYI